MWTDGAGPTSSISWLQEGMAGKMQQNFKRQEKNVQSFQKKSKRKIQKYEGKTKSATKGNVLPDLPFTHDWWNLHTMFCQSVLKNYQYILCSNNKFLSTSKLGKAQLLSFFKLYLI